MLVITVDASSQAPYRSFPCKHENSFIPLLLLFPKSLATFREPCFQSLMPFSPNIVPAQESHRSVAALVPFVGVLARSYPVRTVIHLSIEAVPHSLFRANRKSRFTQHLAERIEIPFQSKKSCKSALMQKSKPVCAPSCQQAENRWTASAFGSSRSVSGSSGAPQPVA